MNDFVVTWMTLTVLVLATQATSVKRDTAYVVPPSVDGEDALALVLAIEYAFVMYCDMVHTVGGAYRIHFSTVWSGFVKLFQNFVQNFVPEHCCRTLLENFVAELCSRTLEIVVGVLLACCHGRLMLLRRV